MAASDMMVCGGGWSFVLLGLAAGGLLGCGDSILPQDIELTSPDRAQEWEATEIHDEGEVEVQPTLLRLGVGQPMTGIRFIGDWNALKLPLNDYRFSYEARRVEGTDFFATATFPVGALDCCVSLVVGGWGGSLVGISSIDYLDASQNSTRGEKVFENNRWYAIRIEVRSDRIRVWIDDRPMIDVSIAGRQLGMRGGEIDKCVPLGFATWRTGGEIRNVRMERLTPEVGVW